MFALVKKQRLSSLQESAQQRRSRHLIDFLDLNVSEVVFPCEAECAPLIVVLENVSYSEGVSVRRPMRTATMYVSGEGMSRYTGYMYG